MRYGFIGCGNMGGAIAKAMANSTKNILLADADEKKAANLAAELGVACGNNEYVIGQCETVFLGVKPQMAEEVLKPLQARIKKKRPTLISMMAGVSIARVKELAGDDSLPVIRILPNTPVAVGKGVIMYHTSVEVQKEVLEQVLADLAPAGVLDEVEEKMIETGGTLTGCGPAYMYMFIDALADGAVALGVSRDKALLYAKLTMAGAAELALQSDKEPEELKQNVCSPGGTTIEGVKVLEEAGFHDAAVAALRAAFEKSKKLI